MQRQAIKKDLFNFIEGLRKVYTQDVILIINKKIDKETILYFNYKYKNIRYEKNFENYF